MLVKSVATLYSDPHRVLMEYIDNAIDAAEEFYDKLNNNYSKPIEINIDFDGKTFDYARIIIEDNCTGINNLSDLVTKIGNSSKLKDENTNGQFGFGIYSFLAICDSLIITTRLANSETINRVELNSKMFESPESEEFSVVEERPNISGFSLIEPKETCWSRFKLEGFSRQAFKVLNVKSFKSEIENHFELILSRQNISVKIKTNKNVYVCVPFDYNLHDGEIFHKEINQLEKTKSKKHKTKISLSIPNNITIHLKVYKNRMIGRKPVFINKGRRITEISNVKAFRTTSKSSIWSHPNITGYIDVTGILEPNISRYDFRPNVLAKALFQKLIDLEPEIKEFVSEQLKLSYSMEYKNLEDILSQTLNKLGYNKNFRAFLNFSKKNKYTYSRNKDKITLNLLSPVKVDSTNGLLSGGCKNQSYFDDSLPDIKRTNDIIPFYDSPNYPYKNKEIQLKNKMVKLDDIENSSGKHFTNKKNDENNVSIIIDCENNPPLDINGNKLRSSMINNQIIIYSKHPMFIDRIVNTTESGQIISNELIFYISIEIMTQIKILVYNSNKNIEDISIFFNIFNEIVYLFLEDFLTLSGKSLSELTSNKKV